MKSKKKKKAKRIDFLKDFKEINKKPVAVKPPKKK
jgi:hypothetical protein